MKVIKDHDLLQMKSGPSIEPTFIKLVGANVVTVTSPVEGEVDAWIKQVKTRSHTILPPDA